MKFFKSPGKAIVAILLLSFLLPWPPGMAAPSGTGETKPDLLFTNKWPSCSADLATDTLRCKSELKASFAEDRLAYHFLHQLHYHFVKDCCILSEFRRCLENRVASVHCTEAKDRTSLVEYFVSGAKVELNPQDKQDGTEDLEKLCAENLFLLFLDCFVLESAAVLGLFGSFALLLISIIANVYLFNNLVRRVSRVRRLRQASNDLEMS